MTRREYKAGRALALRVAEHMRNGWPTLERAAIKEGISLARAKRVMETACPREMFVPYVIVRERQWAPVERPIKITLGAEIKHQIELARAEMAANPSFEYREGPSYGASED